VPLSRVVKEPFVLPSAPHGLRALIEQAAALMNLDFSSIVETNALSVQKSLVSDGHGWTILPIVAISDDVAQGRLSAAPLAEPAVLRKVGVAVPANRQSTAPVRCVVSVLLDCMKSAVTDRRWPSARWLAD
jgi:DNA-binding transcriptional LysR family regulator